MDPLLAKDIVEGVFYSLIALLIILVFYFVFSLLPHLAMRAGDPAVSNRASAAGYSRIDDPDEEPYEVAGRDWSDFNMRYEQFIQFTQGNARLHEFHN